MLKCIISIVKSKHDMLAEYIDFWSSVVTYTRPFANAMDKIHVHVYEQCRTEQKSGHLDFIST